MKTYANREKIQILGPRSKLNITFKNVNAGYFYYSLFFILREISQQWLKWSLIKGYAIGNCIFRDKQEQEISDKYSSLVNEAYKTLLEPLARGKKLCLLSYNEHDEFKVKSTPIIRR